MSRNLTNDVIAAFTASSVRPFFLFEGIFASSTLRLFSGLGDFSFDGETWLGNGWFKGIGDIAEDNSISAHGVDILLSGVPLSLVSLILSEARHSSRGSIYIGAFDSSWDTIDDPYLLFEGALSAPRIDDSADIAEVVLSYEDDLIMLNRSRELRNNEQSQRSIFPSDKGFQYVESIQKWQGFWGDKEKPVESKKQRAKRKSNRK